MDGMDSETLIEKKFTELNENLKSIKGELSEKVHSENVKVYRNVQDLIRETDHSEEQEKLTEKQYKCLKRITLTALVISIINIALTVFIFLSLYLVRL